MPWLIFWAFCFVAWRCRKDPDLFKISLMFVVVHFFDIDKEAVELGALSLILEVCLLRGMIEITSLYNKNDWAIVLNIIMTSSIILILVEFIDYFLFSSTLGVIYSSWIDTATLLELSTFALASNGIHTSIRGRNIFSNWPNIYRLARI